MKTKTIVLVVGDDPNLRKTLADILRVKGYETAVASTGAEAIAAMEQGGISLALIDQVLPDTEGLEVMARIKAISPLTEVIILTGNASLDTAIEATRRGAFSYLLKPYNTDDLLLNIGHGVERWQAQEEILRLALFPRLNPSPVIELDSAGKVAFLNPAAERSFPDLAAMGQSHPVLHDSMEMMAVLRQGKKQWGTVTECTLGEATFELKISYVPDTKHIHIYAVEITERKRLEETLRNSEKEFRTLAEAMPQIVWITRPDGWNIYFNQQWVDYTGQTLEESHGHGWNKPFHPDDQKRAWEAWQNAVNNSAEYSLKCRLRRADGIYKWWLIRGVPLLDSEGTILKWFGTCTEIDDLKQTENALLEKEHLLSESQRLGHVGSFLYNTTGPILWSDELYRIYGVSPDTFTPTVESLLSLIHSDDRPAMEAWIAACMAGEKPDALDFRINVPDGTVRFLKGWGDAVYDDENRLSYIAGMVQDITERKHAEEELQRYSAELEKKNRELQEAFANVKQLSGMLPICASCKKIRDDKGYWSGVETYMSKHTDAVFSHGLCPECEKKANEDLDELIRETSGD